MSPRAVARLAGGPALVGALALSAVTTPVLALDAGATAPLSLGISWASGTPRTLSPGDRATLRLRVAVPDPATTDDVVVDLHLANAEADTLPAACGPGSGEMPSTASGVGRRLTCNLGPQPAGETTTVDLTITVGDRSDVVAVQAGPYDDRGQVVSRPVAAPAPVASYRLLSSPDFLNADVADLRRATHAAWKPGMPNSWNVHYRRLLEQIIADWASFRPDAVTVPGDLVNGRWMRDQDKVGVFGPLRSAQQRREAVRRAGLTYFRAWKRMFTDAGLTVYPGIGDHELGDNPWRGNRINREKRANAGLFRSLFARTFTQRPHGAPRFPDRPVGTPWESTAYALRPTPEVQLVMLDVFRTVGNNTVPELSDSQLAWLQRVLARARADGVDWIVVEGHTPILGPVRLGPSSGLMYREGSRSRLWSLLRQYGVDAYLCGEVHASTAIVRDGIAQVCHGGTIGGGSGASSRGGTSFVVSDFSASSLSMRLYSWDRVRSGGDFWQLARNRMPAEVMIVSDPIEVGSLTITNDGASSRDHGLVVTRTGLLERFDPEVEPGRFAAERS